VVKFPNGDYIMQSYAITKKLEELWPEPSLHLDSDSYDKAVAILSKFASALAAETRPRVPAKILNPASIEYFERTRSAYFGLPLAEVLRSDKAGENAWAAAEPGLQALKALLTEDSSGPYIYGDRVSYGDLVLAANYAFKEALHEDLIHRLLGYDESIQRHYDACKKWLERSTF
jgi:glutathione S-transferase